MTTRVRNDLLNRLQAMTVAVGRLPRATFGRRFRTAAPTLAAAPMGGYDHRNWFRRFRWACLAAFFLFTLLYGFVFAVFGPFLMPLVLGPLAVPLLIMIWLLPQTDHPPVRLLNSLVFALLIVLNCWPDYLAIALPGLPWITAARLVCVPMLLTLLVCAAVSPTFRAQMRDILSGAPLIWQLVVAFAVLAGLTIPLSHHPVTSLNKYVVLLVNVIFVFFASCYVLAQPGRVALFARWLWATSLVPMLVAVWEARFHKLPWAGHIPSFLAVGDENVQRILAGVGRAYTNLYRVQGKFTTPLGLAEFLGLITPFLLHIGATTRSVATRIAIGFTLALMFYVIIETNSRLGVIALSLGFLLYLLFWALMRRRETVNSVFASLVVFSYPLLAALALASTFVSGRIRNRVWGGGAQQSSTDARTQMYQMGLPKVLRNPFGHGIGEGASTLGYTTPDGFLTIDTYYLSVLLEFGVLGFVLFYGVMLFGIWKSATVVLRSRDPEVLYLGPAGIALTSFVIIKAVFSQQENHSLAFILLAMVVALSHRADVGDPQRAIGTSPSFRRHDRDRKAL